MANVYLWGCLVDAKFYRHPLDDLFDMLYLTEEEEKNWQMYLEYQKYKSTVKRCPKCGKLKRLVEFYRDSSKRRGLFELCNECAEIRRVHNAINQKRARSA